ncbi:S41 family peptidase [Yunchengibacter salinarum]|uniref:S41 family peptidase n=1 Tax=Yunchengibacter salinarum TaxID=3133399 RepID=UPI0035B58D08
MRAFVLCFMIVMALGAGGRAFGQGDEPWADRASLARDAALLLDALESLHPALLRHQTAEDWAARKAVFSKTYGAAQGRRDAYGALLRLLGAVSDGGLSLPPERQTGPIKAWMAEQPGLPFRLAVGADALHVQADASTSQRIQPGERITAINGVPVARLLARLADLVPRDAPPDALDGIDGPPPWHQALHLTGRVDFPLLDRLLPLVAPPEGGRYRLTMTGADGVSYSLSVAAISAEARHARLRARDSLPERLVQDGWAFHFLDEGFAYLDVGLLTSWTMDLDWRRFIQEAIDRAGAGPAPAMLIDLRGVSGGDEQVLDLLARQLAHRPLSGERVVKRLARAEVPTALRPHLTTWNPAFYDWRDQSTPLAGGGVSLNGPDGAVVRVPRLEKAFAGPVVLLVDGANREEAFAFARLMKNSGRARLVGAVTGGSLRGVTGRPSLILTLPASGFRVRLPLIDRHVPGDRPAHGVLPHESVSPNPAEDSDDPVFQRALATARRLAGEGSDQGGAQ